MDVSHKDFHKVVLRSLEEKAFVGEKQLHVDGLMSQTVLYFFLKILAAVKKWKNFVNIYIFFSNDRYAIFAYASRPLSSGNFLFETAAFATQEHTTATTMMATNFAVKVDITCETT